MSLDASRLNTNVRYCSYVDKNVSQFASLIDNNTIWKLNVDFCPAFRILDQASLVFWPGRKLTALKRVPSSITCSEWETLIYIMSMNMCSLKRTSSAPNETGNLTGAVLILWHGSHHVHGYYKTCSISYASLSSLVRHSRLKSFCGEWWQNWRRIFNSCARLKWNVVLISMSKYTWLLVAQWIGTNQS